MTPILIKFRERVLDATLLITGICAIASTATLMAKTRRGVEGTAVATPVAMGIADWRELSSVGQRMGPADAKVTVVEFSDFQCPYCRIGASDLRTIRANYANDVAIVFRHFPLTTIHPYARAAALAAECAAEQGHFEALHNVMFGGQRDLGRTPWASMAAKAGIGDTVRFDRCLAEERYAGNIDRDVAAGRKLGVRATPTVILNGRILSDGIDAATIDSLVRVTARR